MSAVAVLYHADCPDGWTAAWVAHRYFSDDGGTVHLHPVTHGDPPPDLGDAGTAYVVDFSYPHDTLVEMAKERRVVVLDHHQTAIDAIVKAHDDYPLPGAQVYALMPDESAYEAVLDMNRSGAGITWDYFHPNERRPPLVDYVEDRDLWRFALPDSEAIGAYIGTQPHTLDAWDGAASTPVGDVVVAGNAVVAHIEAYCRSAARYAYWCEMGGRIFPIANATHECGSDLANHLLDMYGADMAGYFFERADGLWQYGFRSRNGVTVHEFAQAFGGGGHPQAAGCQVGAISHRRVGPEGS